MKRGKDDEKSMEPMFPRLHVNDTERGGPRAPPRNKMALYEQLSIPSQNFNSAMSTVNQGSNNKLNPPLSSQGSGHERAMAFPLQASPSVHQAEERTRIADLNLSLVRTGPENRQEEDFTVPSFVQNNHFRDIGSRDSSVCMGIIQQDGQRNPCIRTNVVKSHDDTRRSLQTETQDRGDEESENSMVDSMSGTDLSPDDVVGIIGQKHFWKARRAIVNQQRVFAVQVFELHRLIKVQKLISESPHILLEESFVGRPLKGFPRKKDASDAVVKTTPKIVNCIDVVEKPDTRVESSAENAVEKTSMLYSEKSSQPINHGSLMGNPLSIPVVSDTNMGPWGLNQPSGHQWLIPVMTPSDGLVYKPYPAPGFMNPIYGPPGSTPIMGNHPGYRVPPPQYPYQGLGSASFPHPTGHGYFPPFGMPVMHPAFVGSGEHMDHYNPQNQSSYNVSGQNNGHDPKAVNLNPPKNIDGQLSTASSPSVRIQRSIIHNEERSDALPLFPTSPVTQIANAGVDRSTRVIKVVPHNARSASESVARIFRSIQEERKQHGYV